MFIAHIIEVLTGLHNVWSPFIFVHFHPALTKKLPGMLNIFIKLYAVNHQQFQNRALLSNYHCTVDTLTHMEYSEIQYGPVG